MSWQIPVFACLAAILIGGFAWYERHHPPARLVALVAALAALAVAGRLVLAPFPNVVATTDVALLTGYALGGPAGFAVGALAAPISNIWLGQGPWTLWQMGAWGLVGLGGAWLATLTGRRIGRLGLAAACGFAGLAYGAVLDLSVMVTYGGEQSLDRYLALSARGVPFNVAHAMGNVAIALAAAPALVRMISRYRTRFEFTWRPLAAAPVALAALVLGLAALTSGPAPARAQEAAKGSPAAETRAWLAREQNPDGGFGASPEFPSSPSMTGWVMLALEAAGQNPLDLRRGGETPVSYLRERLDRLRSVNDLERTILALDGAGIDPRRFGGTDLVAQLRGHRDRDGSIDGEVNLTAFYVLAMRAGGLDAGDLARSAEWLRKAQNRDGGWGFRPDAPSDPDTTGAALQAIAAAGSGGKTSEGAVGWLRKVQRGGGFGLATTGVVNSQSTSWAVQGMVAAGAGGEPLADAIAYIERLRSADGHYRYSSASDQTPIWVTAQALLATSREAFPLAAVPRSPVPARTRPGANPNGQGGGGAATAPPEAGAGGAQAGAPRGGGKGAGSSAARGDSDRGKGSRDGAAGGGGPSASPQAGDTTTALAPLEEAEQGLAPASSTAAQADEAGGGSEWVPWAAGAAVIAVAGGLLWRRRRA